MIVIFLLSSMDGESSTNSSKGIIGGFIERSTLFIGRSLSEAQIHQIAENLNYPLRKLMHVTEYCVLTILIERALIASKIDGKKLFIFSFIIPYVYSCTDEFHQTFVGRTGQFTDTLVDGIGVCIALVGLLVVLWRKNKRERIIGETNELF